MTLRDRTIRRLRARWIFPVDAEPIENGTIEIVDGRITGIDDRNSSVDYDFGFAAIIPGLVNAHTHLEFSDVRQPIEPSSPFTDWIQAVVAYRRGCSTDINRMIASGYRESTTAGSTIVGEIASSDYSTDVFQSHGSRVVQFRELLGLSADRISEQLTVAREHLKFKPKRDDSEKIIRGISPHAPYSVHTQLFEELIDLAVEFDAPLAIHLAETEAELELLANGTGDFVELLQSFGVWQEGVFTGGIQPLDYLKKLAKLDHALVIHGNYLTDAEIAYLADHRNLTVVFCPRTHAWFQHQNHPWMKMMAAGVSVALGTDSRASNPNLSLWQEMIYLKQHHSEIDNAQLLQLGTTSGAKALGFERETGTLTAGKSADLTVISLQSGEEGDPYSRLFSPKNEVKACMLMGKWIHGPES